MPDINMQVFEEAQRNQLVTEVDIQTQGALDDYQVQLSDIANPTQSQDNVVIDRHGEFLPHWNESLDFDTWVKMSMEIAGKHLLMLHGNSNVSSASSGINTFKLFDDFLAGSVDTSLWNVVGTPTPTDGILVFNAASENIHSKTTYGVGYAFGARVLSNPASSNLFWGFRTDTGIPLLEFITNQPSVGQIQGRAYESSAVSTGSISEADQTTWNTYRIGRLTDQADFYVDDSNAYIITSQVTENALPANVWGDEVQLDWIYISKYIPTEPTHTISTPQNIAVALKSLGRAG